MDFSIKVKGPRVGTAIGEYVLDLSVIERGRIIKWDGCGRKKYLFSSSSLNPFMALGRPVWTAVREETSISFG